MKNVQWLSALALALAAHHAQASPETVDIMVLYTCLLYTSRCV